MVVSVRLLGVGQGAVRRDAGEIRLTDRDLWALRWTVPPVPEVGESALWATPSEDVADRLHIYAIKRTI